MGKAVWAPTVSGPLAPYAAGYERWLGWSRVSSAGTAEAGVAAGSPQSLA
jgi:hypothetical protein